MKKIISILFLFTALIVKPQGGITPLDLWSYRGNTFPAAAASNTFFLGTKSNHSLYFKTNSIQKLKVDSNSTGAFYTHIPFVIGTASQSIPGTTNFRFALPMTGATAFYGMYYDSPIKSDVTALGVYYQTSANTASAGSAYTVTQISHFAVAGGASANLGSNSSVTNQYGFDATAMGGATNINAGFRGAITTSTANNKWNCYMVGTAPNYFLGSIGIATTTPAQKLHVVGAGLITTSLGIGAATSPNYNLDVTGTANVSGNLTAPNIWYNNGNALGTNTAFIGSTDNRSFTMKTYTNTGYVKFDSLANFVIKPRSTLGNVYNFIPYTGQASPLIPALYIGQTTPGSTNYAILSDTIDMIFNSPRKFKMRAAGTNVFEANPTPTTGTVYFNRWIPKTLGSITASLAVYNNWFSGNNVGYATGNITSLISNYFENSTYTAVAASTITNLYTVYSISNTLGSNMAATNNWAMAANGNFGAIKARIGSITTAPTATFEVSGTMSVSSTSSLNGLTDLGNETIAGTMSVGSTFTASGSAALTGIVNTGNISSSGTFSAGSTCTTGAIATTSYVNINNNGTFASTPVGSMYKTSGTGLSFIGVTGSLQDMAFFTPGGTGIFKNPTGTNNMHLVESGSCSIGANTTPSAALHVFGNIFSSGSMSITNTSTLTGGIQGKTDASSASAGIVGQYTNALLAVGSATSFTTATAMNVLTLSLAAGDWDVDGNLNFNESVSTVSARSAGIGTVSATIPTDGTECNNGVQSTVTSEKNTITIPRMRVSVSTTTTVYLVGTVTFAAGTCSGYGSISARRIR